MKKPSSVNIKKMFSASAGILGAAIAVNFTGTLAALPVEIKNTSVEETGAYTTELDILADSVNTNYVGNNTTVSATDFIGVYVAGANGYTASAEFNGGSIQTYGSGNDGYGVFVSDGTLTLNNTFVRAWAGPVVGGPADSYSNGVCAGAGGVIKITGTTTIRGSDYDAVAVSGGIVEIIGSAQAGLWVYAADGGTIKFSGAAPGVGGRVNLEAGGILDISQSTGKVSFATAVAQEGSVFNLGSNTLSLTGVLSGDYAGKSMIAANVIINVTTDASGKTGAVEMANMMDLAGVTVNWIIDPSANLAEAQIGNFINAAGGSPGNVTYKVSTDGGQSFTDVTNGGTVTAGGKEIQVGGSSGVGFTVIPEPATYALLGGLVAAGACLIARRRRK